MLGKAKITTKKENDNRALEASKLLKDDEMKKPLLSDNDNNGVNKRENFDKNNSEMSDKSMSNMIKSKKSNNLKKEDNYLNNDEQLNCFEVNKQEKNTKRTTADVLVEEEKTKPATFCHLFNKVLIDVGFCISSYLIILIVAFLRGGHGMNSVIGISYCSPAGWAFFFFAQ